MVSAIQASVAAVQAQASSSPAPAPVPQATTSDRTGPDTVTISAAGRQAAQDVDRDGDSQ